MDPYADVFVEWSVDPYVSKAQQEDERDRELWKAWYRTTGGSYRWLAFKRSLDLAEDEVLLAYAWLDKRAADVRSGHEA